MITSIMSLPAKGHLKERYVTTGKDGTFRFWQAKVLQYCLVCKALHSITAMTAVVEVHT